MDFTQTGLWFQPAADFQGTFDLKYLHHEIHVKRGGKFANQIQSPNRQRGVNRFDAPHPTAAHAPRFDCGSSALGHGQAETHRQEESQSPRLT